MVGVPLPKVVVTSLETLDVVSNEEEVPLPSTSSACSDVFQPATPVKTRPQTPETVNRTLRAEVSRQHIQNVALKREIRCLKQRLNAKVIKNLKEQLQRRNDKIKRLTLTRDRKAVVNLNRRYQYIKKKDADIMVQPDHMDADLRTQLATSENNAMKLEEEVNELRDHNTSSLLREGAKLN